MSSNNKSLLISKLNDKQWKCPRHKGGYRFLLHLNASSSIHRICLECKLKDKIPDNEIISIHELLEAEENTILSTYPVLKDDTISDLKKIESQFDDMIAQIQQFFLQLTEEINNSINKKLKQQQQPIEYLFGVVDESKEAFSKIAQINKLKEAVISFSDNSEEEIHNIISSQISQMETHSKNIEKVVEKFKEQATQFSLNKNKNIKSRILDQIEEITYFKSPKTIPKKILTKIGIQGKEILKNDTLNLFKQLIEFKSINYFEINNESFQQFEPHELFQSVSQLSKLTTLQMNLSSNQVFDKGTESLSLALNQLKRLSSVTLDLKSNQISDKGAESLSKSFYQLKNLNILRLEFSYNLINDKGCLITLKSNFSTHKLKITLIRYLIKQHN